MWLKFPKHVFFVTSPSKSPPKTKYVFFSLLTTRLAESVDGLDSSLAHSPGEFWDCKSPQGLGFLQD